MPLPLAALAVGTAARFVAPRVATTVLGRAPQIATAGYSATTVGAGRPPLGQVAQHAFGALKDSFERPSLTNPGLPHIDPLKFGRNLLGL
jgi:hypothetical protein